MLLFAGVAALAMGAGAGSDVEALEELWPGIRDSSEQVVVTADGGLPVWPEGAERRVRTIVAPVHLPWLGGHVLYLEEFLHDNPDELRRQVLLQLEPRALSARGVQVHLFTFADPRRWSHLDRRPQLVEQLRGSDIVATSGCDLVLTREGDQFRGGTVGRQCLDARAGHYRYIDYQLVISEDLYWYRRRVLQKRDNELQEEVVAFNWFELNEARLYTCRVDWSSTGAIADLKPIARLDLHDQGGRGHFVTPDGRKLELALHSQDWPFAAERDALILLVQDQAEEQPLASAWAQLDARQISLDLGWLQVRCGPIVPETDELRSDARGRLGRGPWADAPEPAARVAQR